MSNLHSSIEDSVTQASALYERLVLLVGAPRTGKTAALRVMASNHGQAVVNVNHRLSEALLEMPIRQRSLAAPRLFFDLVESGPSLVVLDNLELLFSTELKLDPLYCLRQASRNMTVLASFPGTIHDGQLIYAEPGHPEYRRFPAADIITIEASPIAA